MALGSQLGGAAQLLFSPSPTPHVLFPIVLKLMAHESPQLRDENVTPQKTEPSRENILAGDGKKCWGTESLCCLA